MGITQVTADNLGNVGSLGVKTVDLALSDTSSNPAALNGEKFFKKKMPGEYFAPIGCHQM